MAQFIELTDEDLKNSSKLNKDVPNFGTVPATSVATGQSTNSPFEEISLTSNEKDVITSLNGELNQMLNQLGALEMDFTLAKDKVKSQISERKARLDRIIHDKVVLYGIKNVEDYEISVDFKEGKLKMRNRNAPQA
jgi:hypothetical protein